MNRKRLVIFKTDEKELVLPITPQEYEIAQSTAYNKTNICSIGDVYIGGLEEAQTIKLLSFFPAQEYSFSQTEFKQPQEYINAIEKLRSDKTVFRLIISDTEINLPVRVQSFLYGEQDGSNDVEYQIIFGVHRELDTQEVAGWTIPKRKYEKPKSTKKSSSGNSSTDRVPQDTYEQPETVAHGYVVINGHSYSLEYTEEIE